MARHKDGYKSSEAWTTGDEKRLIDKIGQSYYENREIDRPKKLALLEGYILGIQKRVDRSIDIDECLHHAKMKLFEVQNAR